MKRRRKHSKPLKGSPRREGSSPKLDAGSVRLASATIDHAGKKVFVVTEDILLNQLRREGPKIAESFDRLCGEDLEQLSALMSRTSGLLLAGLGAATRERDELRAACSQLLMNASNSFAAAVAVLRVGYVLQPGIILRSLLEAVSTCLHLVQHPKDLSSYKKHTLQSPKTIAAAKRVLPPFGSLYGHFSNDFAHIGELHKSITPVREYTERTEALSVNLSSLRIAAWLMYVTAELLFNEFVEKPRYWHRVEQGYRFGPTAAEKAWMNNYFRFELL